MKLLRVLLGSVALVLGFLSGMSAQAAPPSNITQTVGVCDPWWPTRCNQAGPFVPDTANTASLAVTSSTDRVALPGTGATVILTNNGSTDLYLKLGSSTVTAATTDFFLGAGRAIAFARQTYTYVAAITASSTSTLIAQTGWGVASFSGGGGSGGGGGGAVTVADGADVTQGAKVDLACATDNGSCSVAALIKRNNQDLSTLNVTLGTPFQAGGSIGNTAFAWSSSEVHGGEVGGNQITVQVAQTVTASSAYTSGNAIGGLMTLANAARVSGSAGAPGTSGLIQSVVANMKSAQTSQIDIFVFSANPTGSTCTDKTAFALATADFDKVLGVVSIPATTAWFSGGTASVGQALNLAMPYALSSATSLYGCAVTRGTPTYTAATDVSFGFRLIRN